jgi:hypothetical protein
VNLPLFNDVVFDPVVPAPLVLMLALVLGGLTLWVYGRAAGRLPLFKRTLLMALRLLGIAMALLILLQPSRMENIPLPARTRVTMVAMDSSRSMNQTDAGKLSRFDAARELIWDAGLTPRHATAASADVRLFEFAGNAAPITQPLEALLADGRTTQFNTSIITMLDSLPPGEGARALFLLTDGHDLELTNPEKTALEARSRRTPIYAVALGGDSTVRDVSVRMASFEPFSYKKQAIRLSALIRQLGCPYETLHLTLLREGKPVQTRSLVVHEEEQLPVQFEVTEPDTGQFEYEIRVDPLPGEVNTSNNSAVTYVNVIDKKIRVLVLEGQPYWDTTFLQRSLRRNEKLDVDCVDLYSAGRTRVIRTGETHGPFKMPGTPEDWRNYDIVFLGKQIDAMLSPAQMNALEEYVDKENGVVVFTRGDAFSGKVNEDLQPVKWGALARRLTSVKVARDGGGVAPFTVLADAAAGQPDQMPAILGVSEALDPKPLSATMAELEDTPVFPAMVHRRYGTGQVFSIGVDGLWRWAFNAKTEGVNTVFDRFWDQAVLWLLAGSDVLPQSRFSFHAETANVLLGEKIHFHVLKRAKQDAVAEVPVTVQANGKEIASVTCAPSDPAESNLLMGEFLPEQTGRYTAEARLPDGTSQSARFIVYDDNLEETDVAADPTYLRRLCEASGGRLLRPEEFAGVVKSIHDAPAEASVRTRKITLWDRAWFFWLIGGLFGADWYLRRKWGLC